MRTKETVARQGVSRRVLRSEPEVGAASGALGGAISGAVGRGSMIGAASGAVWGLLMGLFSAVVGPSQPNHAYTNFVNRCLQEKGYEVTGWQ
ncbi:MAG: hypothetical protein JNK03_01490 [Nitrospira sp.]|nr:hypothetical protein [Nitrospira sp.]